MATTVECCRCQECVLTAFAFQGDGFARDDDPPKDPIDTYASLRGVLDAALAQASDGKGKERHAAAGERFEDQQIVQLGEWMGSNHFEIGQACKKAIESTRLPADRARAELLGAINYLAAAVLVLERRKP